MRTRVLTAALFAVASCDLSKSCEGNVESHVDVPTTTDALREWAVAKGLEAEIAPLKRGSKGGVACGHSPACVILLPVLAADAVLPAFLEKGSVTDGEGTVLYAGVFDRRGRLVRARVKDGDTYREIERLALDELKQHPIVERARVRIVDGSERRTKTPLLPQVALDKMYAAALAEEGDGDDRGDLVVEQLEFLGEEGAPAVLDRYSSLKTVDDEELEVVMKATCKSTEPLDGLVKTALEKGGHRTAIATVPCVVVSGDVDRARVLVPRVATAACDGRHKVGDSLDALRRLHEIVEAPVLEAVAACQIEARRTTMRLWTNDRPTDRELVAALHEERLPSLLMRRLEARRSEDRAVLVAALDAKDGPALEIARALARGTTGSPTEAEARRAATVYAAAISSVRQPHDVRHHLLAWLARCNEPCRETAADALRAADPLEPHHEAALLLLAKEHQRFAAALKGVDPARIRTLTSPFDHYNEDTLIAFALVEAGCTTKEVRAGARTVRAKDPPSPCAWSH